jgi:acetylornithine deacetylase
VNELYTLDEAFRLIDEATDSTLKARSFRNNPSGIDISHPIVQKGIEMGLSYYGSPTLSDQAHMNFPTIKIGPGESERSHTPNEFIKLDEIKDGIEKYIKLLDGLDLQ